VISQAGSSRLAVSVRSLDIPGLGLEIFEVDHAPSHLSKIAATFSCTRSAAVSASTRSLRSGSLQFRDAFVVREGGS
jgi:hypothetical protein